MRTPIAMTENARADCLTIVRLMTWLSPAFPVGAFAYSSGLEKVIEDGLVTDHRSLEAWIVALGENGFLKIDAVVFALAHRADGSQALGELNELTEALAGSAERHTETMALGSAFLQAADIWATSVTEQLKGRAAYPVAVGAVAAAYEIALEAGLSAFLHAAVSQLVSASIRCGIIGQKQGLSVLAALEGPILDWAALAAGAELDDLGSISFIADIATMRHETQTTRLFRT
jgi:urease accessory protein